MVKKILRKVLPPIITDFFKSKQVKIPIHPIWSGNYASWEEAKLHCTGYDTNVILNKCKYALLQVKNGNAVYERDSVLFDEIQYSFGLLAGLQKAAIENDNQLSVLDFGGSLGSSYYQNKDFLSGLKKIHWGIVEQSHFVDCGKQNFENESLKFYHTIEECTQQQKTNVLLLSSVLQYLENPIQWINSFNELGTPYIIIDRTAFIDFAKDVLTIQNVPGDIYNASYPAWFFNKEDLIKKFTNYVCVTEINNNFTPDALINGSLATWSGVILKKKI